MNFIIDFTTATAILNTRLKKGEGKRREKQNPLQKRHIMEDIRSKVIEAIWNNERYEKDLNSDLLGSVNSKLKEELEWLVYKMLTEFEWSIEGYKDLFGSR